MEGSNPLSPSLSRFINFGFNIIRFVKEKRKKEAQMPLKLSITIGKI
jgi:hypothetical protein